MNYPKTTWCENESHLQYHVTTKKAKESDWLTGSQWLSVGWFISSCGGVQHRLLLLVVQKSGKPVETLEYPMFHRISMDFI